MVLEQYSNLATTTLSGDITSGALTISVASSGDSPFFFPASPQYRIRIDNEFLLVTGVSGLTWGVLRGQESTAATGHTSGVIVKHGLTAEGLRNLPISGTQVAYGIVPTAALGTGSASSGTFLRGDQTWTTVPAAGASILSPLCTLTDPTAATWTFGNQLAATKTNQGASIYLYVPGDTGSPGNHLIYTPLVSGIYTITAFVRPVNILQKGFVSYAVGIADSVGTNASGNWQVLEFFHITDISGGSDATGHQQMRLEKYGGGTALGTVQSLYWAVNEPYEWIRIQDDGTNRKWMVSRDGYNFITLVSETRHTFITELQGVISINGFNGSTPNFDQAVTILSWSNTAP